MPQKLKSKLILCNVPTVRSDEARRFYGALLGQDFARGLSPEVESYFAPLSPDGVDITITQRFDDSERLTCYFAVDDLDRSIRELTELGAEVMVPPREVPIGPPEARERYEKSLARDSKPGRGKDVPVRADRAGRMAVLLDPDRNHIGLMELDDHAKRHFRFGDYQEGFDDRQVEDFQEAKKLGELVSR